MAIDIDKLIDFFHPTHGIFWNRKKAEKERKKLSELFETKLKIIPIAGGLYFYVGLNKPGVFNGK